VATPPCTPTDLRITLLGTGAPRPSFDRYGPISLIEAGDQRILVDPGPGLRERLLQAGSFEIFSGIEHVLVSHLHFDHTVSRPDLWLTGWLYGRRTPLTVEGPVGTTAMMRHLEQAFAWDTAYRRAVGVPAEGVAIAPRDVRRPDLGFPVRLQRALTRVVGRHPSERKRRGARTGRGRAGARGPGSVTRRNRRGRLANVSLSVHTEPKDAAGHRRPREAADGGGTRTSFLPTSPRRSCGRPRRTPARSRSLTT
jgi:hypothetical protein